jgi:hypothetical protein
MLKYLIMNTYSTIIFSLILISINSFSVPGISNQVKNLHKKKRENKYLYLKKYIFDN